MTMNIESTCAARNYEREVSTSRRAGTN